MHPVQETLPSVQYACYLILVISIEKYLTLSFIILSRNSSTSLNGGIASCGNVITKALSEAAKIIG